MKTVNLQLNTFIFNWLIVFTVQEAKNAHLFTGLSCVLVQQKDTVSVATAHFGAFIAVLHFHALYLNSIRIVFLLKWQMYLCFAVAHPDIVGDRRHSLDVGLSETGQLFCEWSQGKPP